MIYQYELYKTTSNQTIQPQNDQIKWKLLYALVGIDNAATLSTGDSVTLNRYSSLNGTSVKGELLATTGAVTAAGMSYGDGGYGASGEIPHTLWNGALIVHAYAPIMLKAPSVSGNTGYLKLIVEILEA
jgi:hypothetical protein